MDKLDNEVLNRFGALIETYRSEPRHEDYVHTIIAILNERISKLEIQGKHGKRRVQILVKKQIKEIQTEIDTWKLLLQIGGRGTDDGGDVIPFSCLSKVQKVIAEDSDLDRISGVCEWLEHIVERHRPARTRVNYTRTLHAVANAEMDPDASNRGLTYDTLDQAEEEIMLKSVWALLREGKQKQAEEYCERCGQSWRAVSISGGGIPQDDASGNRKGVSGNSPEIWLMWRLSCRRIANTSSSEVEKAVYGYLGGILECVFPMCGTWQDFVWACGRHWHSWRIEQIIHDHVKTHNPGFLENFQIPGEMDERFDSIDKILSHGPVMKAMQDNVFHQFQICAISGKYDTLLDAAVLECSKRSGLDLFPILRFAIHFYLLVDQKCPEEKDPIFIISQVIEKYVELLFKNTERWPSALRYLSMLSESRGVGVFVDLLKKLDDDDQTELLFGTKNLLPGWMPAILQALTDQQGDNLYKFEASAKDPWMVHCDFDLPCSQWTIGSVEPEGQFARAGIEAGWKIIKVNQYFLNEENRLAVKNILSNGLPCAIVFKETASMLQAIEDDEDFDLEADI